MTDPHDHVRIGVVGNEGSWSTEVLADAVAARTGERLLVDPRRLVLDTGRRTVLADDLDLCALDGLVIKKIGKVYTAQLLDRLELLRVVEEAGVPCFSSPTRILRLLNRLSCTVALGQAGLPLPPTVVTESIDVAVDAVRRFKKAVLKPLYSTKARGMRVVSKKAKDLEEVLREHQKLNRVFYLQQLVEHGGRDLAVVFLGEEHLGTYARVADPGSWNTTVREGGRYEDCDPSPEVLALARRARDAFGLDFTSVDVVETPFGPQVFEVSAFGGYRGLSEALGIDAAQRYADYVCDRVKRRRSAEPDATTDLGSPGSSRAAGY